MNKQTKVKLTLVVIPIVVVLLIAAVVALIVTINKMQKDSTGANESLRKVTENVSNSVNTTNTTNTSNTSNSTKSDKKDKENTTDKNNGVSRSVEENRRNALNSSREGSARDALIMALSKLSSDYYSGKYNDVDEAGTLTDSLTAEALEDSAPEYIFEVDSWNKDKESVMVRMQLKKDDSSPVYVAEVSEELTMLSFEEEEEE